MKVFFDTMVYLHYRSLDQMDLAQILGSSDYTVVVPRVTLRELDKHKNTHKSSRIRDRARSVLKKVEAWTKGTDVRPGVSAEFLSCVPTLDYAAHGLDPDWSDDVLIATVFQFKNAHPDEAVVLVTQDSGPRMIASQLGITVRELPPELKLPDQPDPTEVENRELAKTIAALQNALPKLIVSFAGSDDMEHHATFTLPPPPKSMDHDIAQRIEEMRTKWPKQHPRGRPFAGMASIDLVAPEEYERYNRGVDEYIREYEGYIRATCEAQLAAKRTIRFEIEVRNAGTCPAEDVDIHLHFPDGFHLFSADDLPHLPEEPRPPRKPRTMMQIAAAGINYAPRLDLPRVAMPNLKMPGSFTIERTQSYDVKDHFTRIKHGDRMVLPEMYLTFDSYESANSFNCSYIVRPANLPNAVTGELHFVIEKGDAKRLARTDG